MNDFTAFIILASLFMVWLLYYYYKRGFSAFTRIPVKPFDQISDGDTVRVRGIVQPLRRVIAAPFSGRSCVFYEVKVTQFIRRIGGRYRQGYKIEETKAGDLGMICDDGTWVIVEATKPECKIGNDNIFRYNYWSLEKDALDKFLHKHEKKYQPFLLTGEKIHVDEHVILPGDTLWAAGKAEWRDAKDLNFQIPVARYLHISEPEDAAVQLRNFDVYD